MKDLIEKTRTIRRFAEHRPVDRALLLELIDLARLGGSARNCQPWQYGIVTDDETKERIFPHLGWAGYLSDWRGPAEGERPAAYVICLLNRARLKGTDTEAHFDLGVATQNLLLGAMERNIGGCRIGAFSPKLGDCFALDEGIEIGLVVALGYPAETVVLERGSDADDIRYWRDEDGVHHVPKRPLAEVVVELERLP